MSTDLDQLIKKYADELMQYGNRYAQSANDEKAPQNTPATPFTEPTIPPVQTPEMPVILPGEPLDEPRAPMTEPPAVLPPLQSESAEGEPYIMPDIADAGDDEGYLQIRAYTADKALPVEGALIAITSKNGSLVASMLTDRDGLTPVVALKTVARDESLTPQGMDSYDTYNIEIIKSGFLDFINKDVPVFGGITNVQNAALVPLPEFDGSQGDL